MSSPTLADDRFHGDPNLALRKLQAEGWTLVTVDWGKPTYLNAWRSGPPPCPIAEAYIQPPPQIWLPPGPPEKKKRR